MKFVRKTARCSGFIKLINFQGTRSTFSPPFIWQLTSCLSRVTVQWVSISVKILETSIISSTLCSFALYHSVSLTWCSVKLLRYVPWAAELLALRLFNRGRPMGYYSRLEKRFLSCGALHGIQCTRLLLFLRNTS